MVGDQSVRPGDTRTIYLLDTRGRIVGWPRPSEARDGERKGDPRHLSGFYTAKAREAGEPEHDLLLACGGAVEMDGWRVREDGSCFWARVLMAPFQDQAGRLLGIVLVLSAHDGVVANQVDERLRPVVPTKFERRKR